MTRNASFPIEYCVNIEYYWIFSVVSVFLSASASATGPRKRSSWPISHVAQGKSSCHCLECVRRILMEYVTFGYFFCRYVWCLVTLSIEFYVTRLSCTCHVSLVSNWLCICNNAESTFRSCESSIWCIIQICGCYNHSEHRHKWTSGECPSPVYGLVIEHRYFFTSFIFSLTSCKLLTIFSKLPISNVSFFIELLLYLDLYTLSGDVQLHNELHWPFLTFSVCCWSSERNRVPSSVC